MTEETTTGAARFELVFACGATIRAKEAGENKAGSRLVVFTSPQQEHQRPVPPDKPDLRMNCLIGCPARVKDSGRKHQSGWFGNGDKGHIVTCKIKQVVAR